MHKILVIEDDVDIRESIADILQLTHYDYREARNGLEGVKIAQEYMPDLILCDIMMPELDGYGVLFHIRQNPRTSWIPFIFLSAKAARADIRKGMTIGADDYITKPFTGPELLEAIEYRLKRFDTSYNHQKKDPHFIVEYISTTLPHELRTPLTALVSGLQMLEYMGLDSPNAPQIIDIMRSGATSLQHRIENYLLHSNLLVAKTHPELLAQIHNLTKCEEAKLMIETMSIAQAEGYERERDLQFQVMDAEVLISFDYLRKIVTELVDNACKFSLPGTPIQVSGQVNEGVYQLSVTDHGRGMSREQIERIGPMRQFEREQYEQQGMGLGLTIVKQMAELISGDLSIDSVPNEQTTVLVTLPLAS